MYIYCYANVQHSGKMFIPVVGPFLSESAYEHQDIHILFNEKGIVESVQKIEGADTIGGPRLGR
jgi:hypothetical protein